MAWSIPAGQTPTWSSGRERSPSGTLSYSGWRAPQPGGARSRAEPAPIVSTIIGHISEANADAAFGQLTRFTSVPVVIGRLAHEVPAFLEWAQRCLGDEPISCWRQPLRTFVHERVVVQTLEVEPIRGLEVAPDHAASTAFQISGAVLCLTRSLSSLN
jgi:hypothetical protein